jgi:drug/metabolite transporter, DME family
MFGLIAALRTNVAYECSELLQRARLASTDVFDWLQMTSISPAPSHADSQKYGVLFVFAAGVLWSTVGLGIRLIEDAVVWQILLYRSISMSLFLYVLIRMRSGESPFVQIRRIGSPAVIAGLALVAAYSGGIYSIQNTSVANAMLLFATAPFMAAVLGWIVLRERVRLATWIAIAVAVGGIGIMVADKSGSVALKGSLAALGSALGFAVFTVALRWGRTGEMLPAVFLSGLFAIAITLSICFGLGLSVVLSPNDGGIAMGMGVFQVGAGLILYTLGSRSLPAAELALLSLAEVLLGPLWVWLFLGETASVNTLFGGVVLLAAIAGNALSGKRRKPPPITVP